MSTARRMLVAAAAAALVAVPAAACASKTAAPPDPAPATAAPSPATSSSAAPASEDDLVRQTLTAYQNAYNTEDWDRYLDLTCAAARELLTGAAMERLKETRAAQGLTNTTVTAVDVRGDAATATLDARNELLGRRTIELDLVREDGWKVCQLTPVR